MTVFQGSQAAEMQSNADTLISDFSVDAVTEKVKEIEVMSSLSSSRFAPTLC